MLSIISRSTSISAAHITRGLHTSTTSKIVMESAVIAATCTLGCGAFAASRINVAESDQVLVKTGPFILDESGLDINKWTIKWPFQKISVMDLQPSNYKFEFNAMSSEMLNFKFPGSFTIGPSDDHDKLCRYAKFMMSSE